MDFNIFNFSSATRSHFSNVNTLISSMNTTSKKKNIQIYERPCSHNIVRQNKFKTSIQGIHGIFIEWCGFNIVQRTSHSLLVVMYYSMWLCNTYVVYYIRGLQRMCCSFYTLWQKKLNGPLNSTFTGLHWKCLVKSVPINRFREERWKENWF